MCDDIYTREDILKMEGQILLVLEFELNFISSLRILEHMGMVDPLTRFSEHTN